MRMKVNKSSFWLKNATYFDVETGTMASGAMIEVKDGLIAAVSATLPQDAADVVDCSGKYITPGLIDMHVHIVWDGEAAPVRTMLEEGSYVATLRGLANAQASLKNGVTTVRDVGCPDDVAIHLSHAIARGIVDACDIVPCGRALQITGGHVPEVGVIADTSDEILKAIRYLKSIGAKWIKIMATGGAYGPEEIGPVLYSEEEMSLIVREAHRLHMKVAAHALSKVGIINCSGCGAPVDIRHEVACSHCKAAIAILDPEAVEQALARYQSAEVERQSPPNLDLLADAILMRESQKSFKRRESRLSKIENLEVGDLLVAGVGLVIGLLKN